LKRVFVIAEAGVNHNGDIDLAHQLVDAAAGAGADAVKFQTFRADKLAHEKTPKAEYQVKNTRSAESQYAMLKKLQLPLKDYRRLYACCLKKGIEFMSTPFDEESADMLDRLGMCKFKIPSGEITNKRLIQHIAKKGKEIILSTGMSSLGEVESAVHWIEEAAGGSRIPKLTILHCVSNYPADAKDINLNAMKTMQGALKLPVGYSDHTLGIEIAVAAVAMGASVIEKHFTMGRKMAGPDHRASLEPLELKTMVKAIRNVESALGDGIKRCADTERKNLYLARRGVVASKAIRKGEILNGDNLTLKRPNSGIAADQYESVVGRKAIKDFDKNEAIVI
jgi:N,N'-diacetyllegionaminate synthase